MTRAFDPLHRWLGIPPEEQPPNHYRLLGLPLFEDDPDAIESAADRQMAHLRTFQGGANGVLSQKLLNEVAAAKICLLDASKKAVYDEALRRTRKPDGEAPRQAARTEAIAPDLLSILSSSDAEKPSGLDQRTQSKKAGVTLGAIAGGVLLLGGHLLWVFTSATAKPTPSGLTAKAESKTSDESVSSSKPANKGSKAQTDPLPSPKASPEPNKAPENGLSPPQAAPAPQPLPPSKVVPVSESKQGMASDDGGKTVAPAAVNHPPVKEPTTEQPPAKEPQKAPLPAETVQEKILAELEEVYGLSGAKTDEQKCRCARELIERAKKSQDNVNEQFVLLRRAMELASEGSDAALMLQAVEAIEAQFTVDALSVKQKVLTKFAASGGEATRVKSFLENVDEVVDQAVAEDRYELALDLLSTAERLCQKPQGRSYRKPIHGRHQQVQRLSEQWHEVQQAMAALKTQPAGAAANLVLGRWYCVAKEDWPKGLPYLAKGSDSALKALAEEELVSPPKEPEGQVKLADAWWEQAQRAQGESRMGLLRRAAHWYDRALPTLSGLTKTRVEKRLAEIASGNGNPKTADEEDAPGERGKAPGLLTDSEPPRREHTTAKMPGKVIPETIDHELRLPRQGGPYRLLARSTITPQGALLIERGTTILAAPGAAILASGSLSSYGEGDGVVKFRPGVPQAGWDKLALERGSKQVLERFDVRGANRGLYIDEGVEVEVKDSLFLQNKVGVETKRNDKPLIRFRNCLIANSLSDGITLHLSHVELDHCTVANNAGIGINLAYYGNVRAVACHLANNAVGVKSNLYEGHVVVEGTNLLSHRMASIEVKTPEDFQCQGNYWGTTNPQQIAMSIVDGLKKPGNGVVVFKDYRAKPIPDAGCSLKVPKEK